MCGLTFRLQRPRCSSTSRVNPPAMHSPTLEHETLSKTFELPEAIGIGLPQTSWASTSAIATLRFEPAPTATQDPVAGQAIPVNTVEGRATSPGIELSDSGGVPAVEMDKITAHAAPTETNVRGSQRSRVRVNPSPITISNLRDCGMKLETIASERLVRVEWLAMFTVGDLLKAGLELWDTGRAPHYDVVYERCSELVARFVGCPHRLVENQHYQPPDGGASP
jgi:hypothetical protein